jgi:hypothetical protein
MASDTATHAAHSSAQSDRGRGAGQTASAEDLDLAAFKKAQAMSTKATRTVLQKLAAKA